MSRAQPPGLAQILDPLPALLDQLEPTLVALQLLQLPPQQPQPHRRRAQHLRQAVLPPVLQLTLRLLRLSLRRNRPARVLVLDLTANSMRARINTDLCHRAGNVALITSAERIMLITRRGLPHGHVRSAMLLLHRPRQRPLRRNSDRAAGRRLTSFWAPETMLPQLEARHRRRPL